MSAIDAFVKVCERQNWDLLYDNLGIRIDVGSLPTYPFYAEAHRDRYGTHWLSRLWCQHIRRLFVPTIHKRVLARYLYVEMHHKQEFMNAVLAEGQKAANG
jgi:hypothetical protein